jgi:K+-sensing histidine kinase KdpD
LEAPRATAALVEALAHDLKDELTILWSTLGLLVIHPPADRYQQALVGFAAASTQRLMIRATSLLDYAALHGARPSSTSITKLLEGPIEERLEETEL